MHSAPILAPRPTADALHRVQWQRTIAGYIADAVEPLAMVALIGLAIGCASRSSRGAFLLWASVALALTALRRANNAITAWTDLQDLRTYAWLAKVLWIPTFAAWALAWNRWPSRSWRGLDLLAMASMTAAAVGVATDSATMATAGRLGFLSVFAVLVARVAGSGPWRILAILAVVPLVGTMFGGELLDPLGVPGIWFPFNIGVSRGQYLYAVFIPLLALLMVRTLDRPAGDSPATAA